MRTLLILLISFTTGLAHALVKETKYPVEQIPKDLLRDANVVYRLDRGEFIIERIDRAVFKVHQVVTILNERGDHHALVGVGYDKLRKITSFSAAVYDEDGHEIYKLKNKDIIDESNISGGSLYEDTRIQGVDLRQTVYPYTIDYAYEVQFKYLYSIPDWYVIPAEKIAVQRSEYTVKAPRELKPRFKEINVGENIMKESVGEDLISYHWAFADLNAIEVEPFSRGILSVAPIIYASPSKFSYEGYQGDMSTWDAIAQWQNTLNEGRDILPENTINEIKALVSNASSREDKIKRIYHYMQKRTRYVSIQLGIGGFQPFEAAVVDKTGYGDCKALTNYMQALLKAAGIESYYTWVEAGSNPDPVYEDFPNDTFNHIILCVPNEADTIWLECTSQSIPFGYLGKFTADRKVLVISENGGTIVRTPAYDHQENIIATRVTIDLDRTGDARARITRNFRGLGYEYENIDHYLTLTDKDRKDWIHQNLSIANYELGSYTFIEKKDRIPSVQFKADLAIRKLASVSGNRIFIPLNFMSTLEFIPKPDDKRKAPVYLKYSSITADTIRIKLPEHLKAEFVPEEVNIKSPYGSYYMNTIIEGNELTYYRKLILNKGKYSATAYDDFVTFFKNIRSADLKKVVLLDKT